MRTAVSNESVVCANCGERFMAPTHSGRYRQTSERRIKSARYCSPACRQAAYVARRAARADVPHSERHKAFRRGVTGVGSRVGYVSDAGATTLATSVTHAVQAPKLGPKNAASGGPVSIVPDAKWPGMYRLRLPDGRLTDMVNLTRVKDALAAMKGA
jgi:hypothetical protein